MKTRTVIFIAAISSFFILHSAFGQGALTPPGAPGPTMKTLDQVEPRTPLNTLPGNGNALFVITQPGSYYLTTNVVVGVGTNAIAVMTNDVTIDLNGFTLYGTTTRVAIVTPGPNVGRVRIMNGQIAGWAGGIDFISGGHGTNCVFQDLQINLALGAGFTYGIGCRDGARISRCNISGALGTLSFGISVGSDCEVESCQIANCTIGIGLGLSCIVKDCHIHDNSSDGISAGANCIIQNDLIETCSRGVVVTDASLVFENTCMNCSSNGFAILGNANRVDANIAGGNSKPGFITQAGTTNNLVVRNSARGNVGGNYVFNGTQVTGPLVTATGVITTNNPWANFSF